MEIFINPENIFTFSDSLFKIFDAATSGCLSLKLKTRLQSKVLSSERLRIECKSDSGCKLEIFNPMLDRVKGGHKLHGSSYFCEESLHTKFQNPSTFPACINVYG